MFRGAARQTTGAQQRAAEDYVSVVVKCYSVITIIIMFSVTRV